MKKQLISAALMVFAISSTIAIPAESRDEQKKLLNQMAVQMWMQQQAQQQQNAHNNYYPYGPYGYTPYGNAYVYGDPYNNGLGPNYLQNRQYNNRYRRLASPYFWPY